MAEQEAALTQLRATLGALSAAQQLESTRPSQIFSAVSDALGGVTLSSPTRKSMKAEVDAYLLCLASQSQRSGEAEAPPAKRQRKPAAPQRRPKQASSGEEDESEPSAEASEGEEEASDSDFDETSGACAALGTTIMRRIAHAHLRRG